MSKTALITGGAGGLGLATGKYLVGKGWTVYAADYNQDGLDQIRDESIIPLQVDVSDEESVANAVAAVKKSTGSLNGIVNFAGILVIGSVIETEVEMMRRILDINLLGMYRVNQAFFELIQNGDGRIVNISSEYGVLDAVPFHGFYTLSKHAVEVYSDALRRELLFFDIPVIKIRPGAFKTEMVAETDRMYDELVAGTAYYKDLLVKMRSLIESRTGVAKDPVIVARMVYRALTDVRPRLVYSANLNRRQKFLSSLPDRMQDAVYKAMFKWENRSA